MSPRHPHLLVCGFGPFPGVPENPAMLTVEQLRSERWRPGTATVGYALLPTTWGGAVDTVLARLGPGVDAVLLVGVASTADCFRVETQGRNATATAAPDANGAMHPHRRIEADGPEHRPATAPIAAIVSAIAAEGLGVEASPDAGDYLCNYSLYRLLGEADAAGAPRVGFLHLPPLCDAFRLDDLVRAVKAAVGAFAEELAAHVWPAQDDVDCGGDADARRG